MDTKQGKSNEPFKITGDWTVQSKQLKEKYPTLTDDDLKLEKGKENDMLKRVESRLNKGRQEVQNIIRKGQPAAL
jgi:phage anti-repressor protein